MKKEGGHTYSGDWSGARRTQLSVRALASFPGLRAFVAAVPPSSSLSSPVSIIDASSIVSPLLAFIKAHRLRGCTTNLRQAVAAHFDISSLTNANKLLWDHCGDIYAETAWFDLPHKMRAVLTNGMLLKLHLQIFFLLSINLTKMTNSPLL